VLKFYRPGRWSGEQIREEHRFLLDLLDSEVPVVVPEFFEKEGDTLRETRDGLFFCVYPKVGGRQPEDLPPERLRQLGRLIARMHAVGVRREAPSRLLLTPETYGKASIDCLLEAGFPGAGLDHRFREVAERILEAARVAFKDQPLQRIHGDCHAGNVLWNEKTGPFFIDFDDMVTGPRIQDLWLLSPDPGSLEELIEGYHQMGDLPAGGVKLIEVLRALRMVHYAAWIAKRFDDPAFKRAFPDFRSPRYREEWVADLERQENRIAGGLDPSREDEWNR
jgi:Ser/Thr protein kinase RdoA (MazF antagonist)